MAKGAVTAGAADRIKDLQDQLAAAQAKPTPMPDLVQRLQDMIAKQQGRLTAAQSGNYSPATSSGGSTVTPAGSRPDLSAFRRAELDAMHDYIRNKYEQEAAQTHQLYGQAQTDLARETLTGGRNLAESQRGLIGEFGGRDTIRSGSYQASAARDEVEKAAALEAITAGYQREMTRLQLELTQGIRDRKSAEIALEAARIKAAYAMAQLG